MKHLHMFFAVLATVVGAAFVSIANAQSATAGGNAIGIIPQHNGGINHSIAQAEAYLYQDQVSTSAVLYSTGFPISCHTRIGREWIKTFLFHFNAEVKRQTGKDIISGNIDDALARRMLQENVVIVLLDKNKMVMNVGILNGQCESNGVVQVQRSVYFTADGRGEEALALRVYTSSGVVLIPIMSAVCLNGFPTNFSTYDFKGASFEAPVVKNQDPTVTTDNGNGTTKATITGGGDQPININITVENNNTISGGNSTNTVTTTVVDSGKGGCPVGLYCGPQPTNVQPIVQNPGQTLFQPGGQQQVVMYQPVASDNWQRRQGNAGLVLYGIDMVWRNILGSIALARCNTNQTPGFYIYPTGSPVDPGGTAFNPWVGTGR